MVRKSNRKSGSSASRSSSSKSKGGSSATAATRSSAPKMRITRRVVDVKRHTVGFMINDQMYSVGQAKVLASQGRIAGVRVVGQHIQAEKGRRRLVDLPTTMQD